MSESVRNVTSVSWFGRMKRSVGGFLFGLLLVVAMVVLLFWNEGRAVQTAKSLGEGASAVVSVAADAIAPANDGKLVHVSGAVTAGSVPTDTDFGVAKPGVRLVRSVAMYQWKETKTTETKTKVGGGEETVTTYSYGKEWDEQPIVSGEFWQPAGHGNPPMEIRSRTIQIPEGKLGAFTLDEPVLSRIYDDSELPLTADQLPSVEAAYGGTQKVSIVSGRIYLAQNPTNPAIGDYRISYSYVPLGVVSIVARQDGQGFDRYQTEAGDRLLMVRSGEVPADRMFADAVSENTMITWILRIVGLVVLFIAFAMVMAPLGIIADVVPFVGSIVRLGTGLVAFVLAILVGGITIAVAWFWYRPLLSFAIGGASVLIAVAITYIGRKKSPAAPLPMGRPPAPPREAQPQPAPVPEPAAPTAQPTIKW